MVKDGMFVGWIIVSRTESPFLTLVNPAHIENIYTSGDETIVCLTSGKKLVDKRSINQFLKAEGQSKEQKDLSAKVVDEQVRQVMREVYQIVFPEPSEQKKAEKEEPEPVEEPLGEEKQHDTTDNK